MTSKFETHSIPYINNGEVTDEKIKSTQYFVSLEVVEVSYSKLRLGFLSSQIYFDWDVKPRVLVS